VTDTIFISSVQSEFASERRAVTDFIRGNPLLSRYFDVFLFEELPARDRTPGDIYLDWIDRSALPALWTIWRERAR
jgi:ATP-dependent DNA helicase RecG